VEAATQADSHDGKLLATRDSRVTIVAIATLAYIIQAVLHEALGHGLTAWLSGAHQITVSTVALQSDNSSRLISAAGTLANLLFAVLFFLLLLKPERYMPTVRYFLIMLLAGNLFTGTGYFFFSGITNFGDWAQVIEGMQPHWAWRVGLIMVGLTSYYASMLLVASKLRPFVNREPNSGRIRGLTWIPYVTEGVLAAIAGALNPAGLFYVVASALPSTLGANAGLLSFPSMMPWIASRSRAIELKVAPIQRSFALIAVSAVCCLLFILLLGGGLTFRRQ
jgi:hypothetical protein